MVRDVARFRFEQALTVAGKLEINHIVLHHGYVPGTSLHERWVARSSRFWKELLQDKADTIRIHLENLFEKGPELIAEVIDAIADPRITACLDIGHIHCHSHVGCADWIKHLRHRIGYVHMHDNHGVTDEHLGLGEGSIPLVQVCEALEQFAPDAVWALECQLGSLVSSHDWLRTHRFV